MLISISIYLLCAKRKVLMNEFIYKEKRRKKDTTFVFLDVYAMLVIGGGNRSSNAKFLIIDE